MNTVNHHSGPEIHEPLSTSVSWAEKRVDLLVMHGGRSVWRLKRETSENKRPRVIVRGVAEEGRVHGPGSTPGTF